MNPRLTLRANFTSVFINYLVFVDYFIAPVILPRDLLPGTRPTLRVTDYFPIIL